MSISLLQRLPNGELAPALGPLIPSIPCPSITVTSFDITNLSKDPKNEYAYICDIVASGVVTSSLCDVIPNDQGMIEEVRFYHNDGDLPVAAFAVTGNKGPGKTLERPFPFDGRFNFRANAVSVTGGHNTFRIVARDKVYGLDGYSLWAASFAFPYADESDDEEDERVEEPTVTEGPRFVSGGSGGELALYCFALVDEKTGKNLSLIAGVKPEAAFHLKALPGSDRLVPLWPGTSSPAFFTVRPTMQMAPKVPSDAKLTSSMASHPGVALLSPRERFLYGLAQGLGFEGYDLIFDSENMVIGGAGLSKDLRSILIGVELADATGGRHRAEVAIGPPPAFAPNLVTEASSTPALLWHFVHLFRTSDPRADEVVMSLLLGDLSGVGLKGVSICAQEAGKPHRRPETFPRKKRIIGSNRTRCRVPGVPEPKRSANPAISAYE